MFLLSTPRRTSLVVNYSAAAALQTIKPGEVWPDDRGKHIQAHGGWHPQWTNFPTWFYRLRCAFAMPAEPVGGNAISTIAAVLGPSAANSVIRVTIKSYHAVPCLGCCMCLSVSVDLFVGNHDRIHPWVPSHHRRPRKARPFQILAQFIKGESATPFRGHQHGHCK